MSLVPDSLKRVFVASFPPDRKFRQFVEATKDVSDELTFCCATDGLYLMANNDDNSCRVYIFLSADSCKEYIYPSFDCIDYIDEQKSQPAVGARKRQQPKEEDDDYNKHGGGNMIKKPFTATIMMGKLIDKLKASKIKLNNTITLTIPVVPTSPSNIDEICVDPQDPHIHLDFTNDSTGDKTLPRASIPVIPPKPKNNNDNGGRGEDNENNEDDKRNSKNESKFSLPSLAEASLVTMPPQELKRLVIELSIVGSTVRLQLFKDRIEFLTESEAARGHIPIPANSSMTRNLEEEEEAYGGGGNGNNNSSSSSSSSSLAGQDKVIIKLHPYHNPILPISQSFLLRFFNYFTSKPCQLASRVTLGITPNKHLIACYEVDHIGTITYYIADRLFISNMQQQKLKLMESRKRHFDDLIAPQQTPEIAPSRKRRKMMRRAGSNLEKDEEKGEEFLGGGIGDDL